MHCVVFHCVAHAGHLPPVSNVFHEHPQLQDQRSWRRGCHLHSGQRMRPPPIPASPGMSAFASRCKNCLGWNLIIAAGLARHYLAQTTAAQSAQQYRRHAARRNSRGRHPRMGSIPSRTAHRRPPQYQQHTKALLAMPRSPPVLRHRFVDGRAHVCARLPACTFARSNGILPHA